MKKECFIAIFVLISVSGWSSTNAYAVDFINLVDGYKTDHFPVIKLPWLAKEAYFDNSLPKNDRIFSKKKDFRIEELTIYQRRNPAMVLFFYKNQLCEIIYMFDRPPEICLEKYRQCDDFGLLLALITKIYGPGKKWEERLTLWPSGYDVERKRIWKVGDVNIGLYAMKRTGASLLLAKHELLEDAVAAAQQKFKDKIAE